MDNSAEIMFSILEGFMLTPGFPFRFGLMIAAAVVLGFNFSRIRQFDVKAWLIIMVIFLVFQEWIRSAITSPSTNIEVILKPWILAFTSGTIFVASLWFGSWIAKSAKQSARKEHLEAMEYAKGQKEIRAKI